MFGRLAAALLLLTIGAGATPPVQPPTDARTQWARQCKDWDAWDKRAPPFKVWGNTYYVGTCGISAILISGGSGAILIDGRSEEHTSELQSLTNLVCRLLLEIKKAS